MRFVELTVWNRAAKLIADIHKEMKGQRGYGFRDQPTMSGLSIPSNIAEGFERGSDREFCKFLWYAKGSSGEVRTRIDIGVEVRYIDRETCTRWLQETVEISSMLAGPIKAQTGLPDQDHWPMQRGLL